MWARAMCYKFATGQVETSHIPVISAEQLLVLPNIGEFDTKGKTLADLKNEVYQKASEVFRESKLKSGQNLLSLTLYQPRRIFVTVKGNVESPNVYVLSAATRADVAIALANKVEQAVTSDLNLTRQIESEQQNRRQLDPYSASARSPGPANAT